MDKIVVSNTTPIITLLGVDKIGVLQNLYEKIYIPEAVYVEIEQGREKPFYTDLKAYDWIEIKKIENETMSIHLKMFLDDGEAEALTLAEELKSDLILLDERLARNYAKTNGFMCKGTFGILLTAKDMGLVNAIKPLIEKAKENGIHMGNKLIQQILTEANEL